jgi:hypothetical protein
VIIFFEYGRLGNQLFQYAALKQLYPNQRLVFFGCVELRQALESIDAFIIEKEKLPRWVMFGLKQLFPLLARLRIIGTIQESHKSSIFFIRKIRGAIFNTYLLKPSFFQHQKMLEQINPHFKIHHAHCRKALDWLSGKSAKSDQKSLVFIHVRRADYLTWPSREYPAVLDKHWYYRAMDQVRAKVENPTFLILTDDFYYARDCFGDEIDIMISDNDQSVDLALMSLCQHGILSASSFAWWGAWFSKARSHDEGVYIAPKYWGGHRQKEWMPKGFVTHWIAYIE